MLNPLSFLPAVLFIVDLLLTIVEDVVFPYSSIIRTSKTLEPIPDFLELNYSKVVVVLSVGV